MINLYSFLESMADYVFDDQQSYLKQVFNEYLQMWYQKNKKGVKSLYKVLLSHFLIFIQNSIKFILNFQV